MCLSDHIISKLLIAQKEFRLHCCSENYETRIKNPRNLFAEIRVKTTHEKSKKGGFLEFGKYVSLICFYVSLSPTNGNAIRKSPAQDGNEHEVFVEKLQKQPNSVPDASVNHEQSSFIDTGIPLFNDITRMNPELT
jgi:hypothetical protein